MVICFVPFTLAAAIKSLWRSLITAERVIRAYFAQLTTTRAKIALMALPPIMPAMAMANTTPGKDNIISVNRINTSSILPLKKPDKIPITVPTVAVRITRIIVMNKEVCVP